MKQWEDEEHARIEAAHGSRDDKEQESPLQLSQPVTTWRMCAGQERKRPAEAGRRSWKWEGLVSQSHDVR
jgi:hypothetical protein